MTTIHDDLIERSADIRWPDGFDPDDADLFAHNAVIINAPTMTVWAKLVAAAAWPTWYSNASDVVIDDPSGELGEHVTFNWTTFGLTIASKVADFVPYAAPQLVRQRRSVARLSHLAAHPSSRR